MTNDERDANDVMEKKLRCVSLLLDCPLNRNAQNCPFHRVRQEESVATRVNWVKSLDGERLTGLLARHEKCMGGMKPVGPPQADAPVEHSGQWAGCSGETADNRLLTTDLNQLAVGGGQSSQ